MYRLRGSASIVPLDFLADGKAVVCDIGYRVGRKFLGLCKYLEIKIEY